MGNAKRAVAHKHFRLDSAQLKRAQKALAAKTETETIERALEMVISEHERNVLAMEANRAFLQTRTVVQDVFGTLER